MPASPPPPAQNGGLKSLVQSAFGSLNLSDSAQAMPDSDFTACQNAMPYANGNLLVFPNPLKLFNAVAGHGTVSSLWAMVVADVAYAILQMSDGYLYAVNLSSFAAVAITTGTSIGGLHLTKWQGQAPDVTLTNATWAGGVATFTVSGATNPYIPGEVIVVTGLNPAGYNGAYLITAIAGMTFKVTLAANPGAYVSGGEANNNPEAVVFSDTTLGLSFWTGTAALTFNAALTGQCLTAYSGRLWVVIDQNITYSAPDSFTDFNLSDLAGSFQITEPSMNGPPLALLPSQNWMYIVGSSLMALNNVQVQSLAGSTTLVTTFFLTLVSSSIGITNERAALIYESALWLVTDIGVYAFYGLTGSKISKNMGDNFSGGYFLSFCEVLGKTLLVINNGYVLMLQDRKWFNVYYSGVPLASPWLSQATLIFDGLTCYVSDAGAVYQFGADTISVVSALVHTKLYDAGNPVINKQVTKFGIEYFQSQLIQPPAVGAPWNFSYQADGFVSSSNRLAHAGLPVAANGFYRDSINLIDRYFSTGVSLNAYPGTAISGFYWQFQDSTSWP